MSVGALRRFIISTFNPHAALSSPLGVYNTLRGVPENFNIKHSQSGPMRNADTDDRALQGQFSFFFMNDIIIIIRDLRLFFVLKLIRGRCYGYRKLGLCIFAFIKNIPVRSSLCVKTALKCQEAGQWAEQGVKQGTAQG